MTNKQAALIANAIYNYYLEWGEMPDTDEMERIILDEYKNPMWNLYEVVFENEEDPSENDRKFFGNKDNAVIRYKSLIKKYWLKEWYCITSGNWYTVYRAECVTED